MENNNDYLSFCGGTGIKGISVEIYLPPDILFKLERICEKDSVSLQKCILKILSAEAEKAFPGNKNFYKKYFE